MADAIKLHELTKEECVNIEISVSINELQSTN
jgi:hypothetical protein